MPRHDFLASMPPEKAAPLRRRIAAHAAEMERLHGLPDRWLGEAVLKLARQIRSEVPDMASQTPDRRTTNGYLLWDAIPEMARRLGCAVTLNEAGGGIRGASAWDLRLAVGHSMWGLSGGYLSEAARPEADLCPVGLLTREVANGSPIAILLDRVAPPAPGADDRCARHVREISTYRGLEPREAWDPTMMTWGDDLVPEVDEPDEAPGFSP